MHIGGTTKYRFWMVYGEGQGAPTSKHDSEEAANVWLSRIASTASKLGMLVRKAPQPMGWDGMESWVISYQPDVARETVATYAGLWRVVPIAVIRRAQGSQDHTRVIKEGAL